MPCCSLRFPKLLLPLLAALLLNGSDEVRAQEVLDGIAAVVNGDVITFSQVRELVAATERSLKNTYKGKELVDKITETRKNAVKDLVDRQLILQEFKRLKATIPEFVLEDRIQTIIREEFGGDRAAFLRTLQAQGYTITRFREVEMEKIIVQAMRQKSVKSDITIPPTAVAEYYKEHREEYSTPEQVKLRMIVIKKDSLDPSGPKAMAAEIRTKVESGAEFDKLAQMYSEDSTQESGGDWGWIDRKTLNEELTKAAFSLKPGEVSKVLEMGDNYYLLYSEARKKTTTKPIAEVREEIEKKLLQTERQKLQQKWLDGLRKKAFIKTY